MTKDVDLMEVYEFFKKNVGSVVDLSALGIEDSAEYSMMGSYAVRKIWICIILFFIRKGSLGCKNVEFNNSIDINIDWLEANMIDSSPMANYISDIILGIMSAYGWNCEAYVLDFEFRGLDVTNKTAFIKCCQDVFPKWLYKKMENDLGFIEECVDLSYVKKASVLVYTNDKLSKVLLHAKENEHVVKTKLYENILNIKQLFHYLTFFHLEESSILWYRNKCYFVEWMIPVYSESSWQWVNPSGYYFEIHRALESMVLDLYLDEYISKYGLNNI